MNDYSMFVEEFTSVVRQGGWSVTFEKLEHPEFRYEGCRVVMVEWGYVERSWSS